LQGTVAGRDGTTLPAGSVPVTVIIAARNEAGEIGDCVRSVSWAREVLVVENDSTDGTIDEARAAGATVFRHPFTTIGRSGMRRSSGRRSHGSSWSMPTSAVRRPSAPRSRAW